jgi:hypothetical protein
VCNANVAGQLQQPASQQQPAAAAVAAGWRLASLTQMADTFANMKGPTFKLALLAVSALLCAARGALAVGLPYMYSRGLRTSRTTSRTSRARSRGRV